MNLETHTDLAEYISEMSPFYREIMHEYFIRLHNFSGADGFGNALEEIPVSSLVSPTFNENVLVQAVSQAAKIHRDFKELTEIQTHSFQQFTAGKPYIKDEVLHNAYSLPVREMIYLFAGNLDKSATKMKIRVSKQYGFYPAGRSHYVFYKPRINGLPWEIVSVLYQNFKQKPLSAGMILKSIKSKKILDRQDVTSAIKDINDIFKKKTSKDFPLIDNQQGYLFNDNDFELELD